MEVDNDIYEGQLYKGRALRASESRQNEERNRTVLPNGVSETSRVNEGQDLGRDRRLGDGRIWIFWLMHRVR